MDYWGVKSYENDDAGDALDAGFARVHGTLYDEFMDDRNPLSFEQVQARLASMQTLEEAITALRESLVLPDAPEEWDETARLALAGIVVRYAELGVSIPPVWLNLAIDWLEKEEIEWEEATARRFRRQKEIDLLRRADVKSRFGPNSPGGS
jgi:DNA-binding transcriptional regulator/RsmH inhibitor MraZ